ncbi:MAG: hypothetical protein M1339_00360 [Bacteroidetes bacterium]|nr:hypothetical protein [Bacteroidota bacterium]
MNLTIVGGCFPVQHNIPVGRLYHETLKKLLSERGIDISVDIIRYERLSKCFGKIAAFAGSNSIDLLLFHLRAEPLMRLSKFYYKHVDDNHVLKRSVNMPILRIINPEKYEVPITRKIQPHLPGKGETQLHHALREVNYIVGSLVGNRKFALMEYMKLVKSVVDFCQAGKINLLVVGPVSRPFSRFENRLSEKIDSVFSKAMDESDTAYLHTLGRQDEEGRNLFFENGVHVSQAGHDRMAKLMLDKIIAGKLL